MTTDPTQLQERIARARSLPAEWARRRDGETTMEQTERWRKRQDEQTAAIIAAEVRKAQADAWDESAEAFDNAPELWPGMIAAPPNPYRNEEED